MLTWIIRNHMKNQLLICLVVIDTKLGREDHNLIPRNCDRKEDETIYARTDPRTRLSWWWKQKKKSYEKHDCLPVEGFLHSISEKIRVRIWIMILGNNFGILLPVKLLHSTQIIIKFNLISIKCLITSKKK
jgi:hypothetical protein